jgi:hypothetical protein
MKNFYEISIEHLSEEGKTLTDTAYVEDTGLLESAASAAQLIFPNLIEPSFKSIKRTSISKYIEQEEKQRVYKCKLAYVFDHPTKKGKEKTSFDYILVDADTTGEAADVILNYVKANTANPNEKLRVDSTSKISCLDIITKEQDEEI